MARLRLSGSLGKHINLVVEVRDFASSARDESPRRADNSQREGIFRRIDVPRSTRTVPLRVQHSWDWINAIPAEGLRFEIRRRNGQPVIFSRLEHRVQRRIGLWPEID